MESAEVSNDEAVITMTKAVARVMLAEMEPLSWSYLTEVQRAELVEREWGRWSHLTPGLVAACLGMHEQLPWQSIEHAPKDSSLLLGHRESRTWATGHWNQMYGHWMMSNWKRFPPGKEPDAFIDLTPLIAALRK